VNEWGYICASDEDAIGSKKAMKVNDFGITFHHFGLAVREPQSAFLYLKSLDYSVGEEVYDPLQRVNLAMCHHEEMPDIEVIWPGNEPSPIDTMLKREDSRIYHLCYTTDDPDVTIARMLAAGLSVLPVTKPEPAVLFGGLFVSFYVVEGIGLIELIEKKSADACVSKPIVDVDDANDA
jgi:hypothetical protein